MNNYDRIKSMSVEEMAEFIRKIQDETIQKFSNFIMPPYTHETEQWLLQEVSVEN